MKRLRKTIILLLLFLVIISRNNSIHFTSSSSDSIALYSDESGPNSDPTFPNPDSKYDL